MAMGLVDTARVILTGSSETDLSATNFDTPFRCEDCNSQFETEIRPNKTVTCPECGSENVNRA